MVREFDANAIVRVVSLLTVRPLDVTSNARLVDGRRTHPHCLLVYGFSGLVGLGSESVTVVCAVLVVGVTAQYGKV